MNWSIICALVLNIMFSVLNQLPHFSKKYGWWRRQRRNKFGIVHGYPTANNGIRWSYYLKKYKVNTCIIFAIEYPKQQEVFKQSEDIFRRGMTQLGKGKQCQKASEVILNIVLLIGDNLTDYEYHVKVHRRVLHAYC